MPVTAPEKTHDLGTRAAITARDVIKTYGAGDTSVNALNGVSARFAAGTFTAIMGRSGSGKSTLMHCLAGLDAVTSGSVVIGDTELVGLADKQLTLLRRQRVGFVFQAFNLLPRATARGLTNQEIADHLHISLSTVKTHLSEIQTKLGTRNRVGIATWASATAAWIAELSVLWEKQSRTD